MELLYLILILVISVVSAGTIWLGLPGSFLMLGFIFIWGWAGDFALISFTEIIVILAIMIILELMEFVLSGLAVRYTGAGKRSAFLAIIGGLLGTIILGSLFFLVGAITGLLVGSYLGAFWGERQAGKDKIQARKAAIGALVGTIAAKVIKSSVTIMIGVWMIKEVT